MTSESTLNNETVTSNPDKAAIEKEKQALDKLKVCRALDKGEFLMIIFLTAHRNMEPR